MTKHRVSELEGMLLDAAVAKAEGFDYFNPPPDREGWAPSRGWEVGGPIIERERIHIGWVDDCRDESKQWTSFCDCIDIIGLCHGPTPLIAAMRAYVASYFGGEEVELP